MSVLARGARDEIDASRDTKQQGIGRGQATAIVR